MGGERAGAAHLNPVIIGGLPLPERLAAQALGGLPEPDVPAVLNVVGRPPKGLVLDAPKDVEGANWRRRVRLVREAGGGDPRGGLWGNRIGNQPSCSGEALRNL